MKKAKSKTATEFEVDFEKISRSISALLSEDKKPTLENIKKDLQIKNDSKDQVIDYYVHIWEQRHAPSFIDDVKQLEETSKYKRKSPKNYKNADKKLIEQNLILEETLSMMRATIEATADCILMINKEGKMQGWNQKFIDLYRIPKRILKSKDETDSLKYVFSQVVDPKELANLVTEKYNHPVKGNCGEMYFKDGRVVERYYHPQIVNGEVIGHVWSFRDISQRKAYEKDLKLKQRAIDSSQHGIAITKVKNNKLIIIDINPTFSKITSIKKKECLEKNLITLMKKNSKSFSSDILKIGIKKEKNISCELCIKRKKNKGKGKDNVWCSLYISPVKNESNKVSHFICILVDISDRKALESELLQKATHDFLTKLPNRTLIIDRILHAIKVAQRTKTYFAVFFLDLDDFKLINDGFGHKTGDELLKVVGDRLKHGMREVDTIGRLGGDEFFVISRFFSDKNSALTIASRLLSVFSKPFTIGDHSASITASIGGCVYPEDGKDVGTLMQNADIAMYQAKNCGRNTSKFFRKGMNRLFLTRLEMINFLRESVQKKKMFIVYQPIIDLKTKEIKSVEALVRFQDLEKTNYQIRELIDVAEESGLINVIGEWVLKNACEEINKLHKKTKTAIKLTVNISSIQIKSKSFSSKVKKIIKKTKFPISQVELELTESVLMNAGENELNFLIDMKKAGVDISLDDFGTGYSNLSYLHKFPISKLKIDKSFVDEIKKSSVQSHLINAIISMANCLGMIVVAEGVETKLQYNYLKENNCHEIQGYYISKPLTAGDLLDFIVSR